MLQNPPEYFESIRDRAERRWKQLEADPELAAPWYQLFRQVQSPRHVISELLQNADDAGARYASVSINDDAFEFTHDGHDFTEEEFKSLCRFGYSNKRTLRTIGFRGVGFKSLFSLGDTVEVITPSVSVEFGRNRFTLPVWKNGRDFSQTTTSVRVALRDRNRRGEIERNLEEWKQNAFSLLFFSNVRCLELDHSTLNWHTTRPGPIADSIWVTEEGSPGKEYLYVRSAEEEFSSEAFDEIRRERLIEDGSEFALPPCVVELVLGGSGRLHVVLPTEVACDLPFSINAPFIQDPARVSLKDPAISPTNRWLLERAGKFAGELLLAWLNDGNLSPESRAGAYALVPKVPVSGHSIAERCTDIVARSFRKRIEGEKVLLTHKLNLVGPYESIALPRNIYGVWSPEQAAKYLDPDMRSPLSDLISDEAVERLSTWELVGKVEHGDVVAILRESDAPKPSEWKNLLALWAYVGPGTALYGHRSPSKTGVRIVPVHGKETLCAPEDVTRIGEKRLLSSEADWDFLSQYMVALNQNFTRFLTEQQRLATENNDRQLLLSVQVALTILREFNLDETSDPSDIVSKISDRIFAVDEPSHQTAVRLTQICAHLGVKATDSFRFLTRDDIFRRAGASLVYDGHGSLDDIMPDRWMVSHALHPVYTRAFTSCSLESWVEWISSGKAGVGTIPPLARDDLKFWRIKELKAELMRRGCFEEPERQYKTEDFLIVDQDFQPEFWRHWEMNARTDQTVWGKIVERILELPRNALKEILKVDVFQVATTGTQKSVIRGQVLPTWLLKLRELECLRDTHGMYQRPDALFRRTAETESLIDVEPFIDIRLDTEAARDLLRLLGVLDTPTDAGKILERIRALAKAQNPPLEEVIKWYRRLDGIFDRLPTEQTDSVRSSFETEQLIFVEGGEWTTTSGAFIRGGDDDIPGANVIIPPAQHLQLWRRLGVSEHPTSELVLRWLKSISTGFEPKPDALKRIRAICGRYPTQVWSDTGHWLNLEGKWTPVRELRYSLSMQGLVSWAHLHPSIKSATADLQSVSSEFSREAPFTLLQRLSEIIQERFEKEPKALGPRIQKAWMKLFGESVARISTGDEGEDVRLQKLGLSLSTTQWQLSGGMEVVPYVDGTPAGVSRSADIVWHGDTLYVRKMPMGKLAHSVPMYLGKKFGNPDLEKALHYCYERPEGEVEEYLRENFTLHSSTVSPDEPQPVPPAPTQPLHPAPTGTPDDTNNPSGEEPVGDDGAPTKGTTKAPPSGTAPSPPRVQLIERFALSRGFRKKSEDRFEHPDGSWIGKEHYGPFSWQLYTRSGNVLSRYRVYDSSLEKTPLQIEADVWSLLDRFPSDYALVLLTADDQPTSVTGGTLKAMVENGSLEVFPATYRIVLKARNE